MSQLTDVIYGTPGSLQPGAENPFGLPDLSYLKKKDEFDYLKNPYNLTSQFRSGAGTPLDFTSQFRSGAGTPLDFTSQFKSGAGAPLDLASQYKSVGGPVDLTSGYRQVNYNAPINTNEAMFQDLLGNINAPSSVDQVQSQIDSERMNQLLEGIGIDEKSQIGSSKSDFQDRGLGGPGQISDIEANALAQSRSDANRLRAGTRTNFASQELERLKAREMAGREAYGARYAAGTAADTQARDIASRGALQDAATYNELYGRSGELTQQGRLADASAYNALLGQSAELNQKGSLADAAQYNELLRSQGELNQRGSLADAAQYNELLRSQGELNQRGSLADASQFNDLLRSQAEMNQKGGLAYADIANQRDSELARLSSDLYSNAARNQIAGYVPGKDNLLDKLTDKIDLKIGLGGGGLNLGGAIKSGAIGLKDLLFPASAETLTGTALQSAGAKGAASRLFSGGVAAPGGVVGTSVTPAFGAGGTILNTAGTSSIGAGSIAPALAGYAIGDQVFKNTQEGDQGAINTGAVMGGAAGSMFGPAGTMIGTTLGMGAGKASNRLVEGTDKKLGKSASEFVRYTNPLTSTPAAIKKAKKAIKKLCFVAKTFFTMADNSRKAVEEIKLGDNMKDGGLVYSVRQSFIDEDMFSYKGIHVTGSHAVYENGRWIRVSESESAKPIVFNGIVYSISNENHKMISGGIVLSDEHETDNYEDLSIDESLEKLNRTEVLKNHNQLSFVSIGEQLWQ